jgi:hypothetical protein
VPIAVIQEFPIEGNDRTTGNYDQVQEALGARDDPDTRVYQLHDYTG